MFNSVNLLDRLDEWKRRFGSGRTAELERLLATVARHRFRKATSLIGLHETLLFLRAYPRSAEVARRADRILLSFANRVAQLSSSGVDLGPFEEPEVSGMAGTSFTAVFSYHAARQLAARHPRDIEIDWERYDDCDRLGPVIPRFLPWLDEDWPVEAHVPFQDWVRAARGPGGSDLEWLLERIQGLPLAERAGSYDALGLPLAWKLGNSPATRSRMRFPARTRFYHRTPLLKRSDVSLAAELEGPALPITRLSPAEAKRILDLTLDTSAVRYRELYGFIHPDTRNVYRAEAGRGVDIFFFGVGPEWRLPLRAYHSAVFSKNGVPIGYVEVLSLFERAEVGFNLYYTFREGESAWLYARVLRLFHQILGVNTFSVDPYQLGHLNDEAIDSGAFWFYRKLGFRPVDPAVLRLTEREEHRLRTQPGYRTPPPTLRRLAHGYMLYEGPGSQSGAWDRFRVRNLGVAVTRRLARRFGGDEALMRAFVGDSLGVPVNHPLALVFALIPGLDRWTPSDKSAAAAILRAKEHAAEARYLRLLQCHPRLRLEILRFGASSPE